MTAHPSPTGQIAGIGRCAILGLGQIGSSIGLALRCAGLAEVVGYDPDPGAAAASLAIGAVDELSATGPAQAVAGAGLVVLAAPVGAIPGLVDDVASELAPGAVLTDVGSTKAGIVAAMDNALGDQGCYAGGHPMAGGEGRGPAAASAGLFRERRWAVCPGPRSSAGAIQAVTNLAVALGARPVLISPEQHDEQVAWTSHLPYLVAAALALSVARQVGDPARPDLLAAGSLLDGTRVAASDIQMAGDYCWANRGHLRGAIRDLRAQLKRLLELLTDDPDDEADLRQLLGSARDWRMTLAARLPGAAAQNGGGKG